MKLIHVGIIAFLSRLVSSRLPYHCYVQVICTPSFSIFALAPCFALSWVAFCFVFFFFFSFLLSSSSSSFFSSRLCSLLITVAALFAAVYSLLIPAIRTPWKAGNLGVTTKAKKTVFTRVATLFHSTSYTANKKMTIGMS